MFLLRYVVKTRIEVSFNFHLTFLLLNVIKMFTVHCSFPYSRLFSSSSRYLELPITGTFFDFP